MKEDPAEAEAVVGSRFRNAQECWQPYVSRLQRTELGADAEKKGVREVAI